MEKEEKFYINVANAKPITLTQEEINTAEVTLQVKVNGKILGFVYPKISISKKPTCFKVSKYALKKKKKVKSHT